MKSIKAFLGRGIPVCLAVIALLTSCVKDHTPDTDRLGRSEEVTFVINVPGQPASTTRAIDEKSEQDNRIDEITVLFFDNTTKIYKTFSTCEKADIKDVTGSDWMKKTFTVTVSHPGTYDALILANSRDIANSLNLLGNHSNLVTKNMDWFITNLSKDLGSAKWNATPSDGGYKPFPMFGRATIVAPKPAGPATEITMIRMLSKINLRFGTKALSDQFTISEVRLCNYNTQGNLVSKNWNYTLPTSVETQALNAKASTVKNATGLSYSGTGVIRSVKHPSTGETVQGVVDDIFLFEVAKPASADGWKDATCLLVKGKFTALAPNGATGDRWFRINIRKKDGGGNPYHINVVRNYRYDVTVSGINGLGHPTAEIAYASKPEGFDIGIAEWNESMGALDDYATDGQYLVGITPKEFNFNKNASTGNKLYIYTDYTNDPAKITVTPKYDDQTNKDWLTNGTLVYKSAGNTGGRYCFEYTFNCVVNDKAGTRTGKLEINVNGRFKISATVTQNNVTPAAYLTASFANGSYSATVPQGGGTQSINISSNQTWALSSDNPAATFSTSVGTGDKNGITVTVAPNKGSVLRTITLTAKGGPVTSKLTVTQAGLPSVGILAPQGVLAVDSQGVLNLDGPGRANNYIVYFKWGSMIGLSSDEKIASYNSSADNREAMIVYRPAGYTDTPATWDLIPYIKSDLDAAYLNGTTKGTSYIVRSSSAAGIGDPCLLAAKSGESVGTYRMPKGYPMETWGPEGQSTGINIGQTLGNVKYVSYSDVTGGTFSTTNQATQKMWAYGNANFTLPAVGMRSSGSSMINPDVGYYWSSTYYGNDDAYYLNFSNIAANPSAFNRRNYAFPIRCIKD